LVNPFRRSQTGAPGGVSATAGLLLALPVLVFLLAVLLVWFAERDAMRAASDQVAAAARVSASSARVMVESTLDRLELMDQELGPNPAAFRPRSNPSTSGFFIALYDTEGNAISAEGERGASVASNADFRALAAGKPWTITPLIGAGSAVNIFGIARRLERNGEFAGVLTALRPAEALSDVWATLALGPDSTVVLVREDGWLITRFPVPAEAVDLSKHELFTEHLPRASSGVYRNEVSPIDGLARTIGYERLDDLGIVAVAGMSQTTAAEGFWSRVRSIALFTAPVFVALLFLCGWTVLLLLRQERSRAALEAAVAQNRVLFQEIHHRVKNNLQAVASLVKLQSAPAQMKEDLIRRISAMSAVHQHMYETDQFGDLEVEGYLSRLLASLRDSAPPGVELDWRIGSLRVSPDQALPLGLIVNEVLANAFRHGFPAGKTGNVSVTLDRPDGSAEAILTIADNGVGMADGAAGSQGLGSRLIAGLVQQLEGKSSIVRDGGVRFELRFPVKG
jgi:two-component system, sensor histidine kinase PdtaS